MKFSIFLTAHFLLLIFLIITGIAAIKVKDLLSAIIIFSAYSFTMAITYLILRAPDVAMTEAGVGAGVATILFLAAYAKTVSRRKKEGPLVSRGVKKHYVLFSIVILGLAFIAAVMRFPPIGDPHTPSYGGFIDPDVPNQQVPKIGVSVPLRYNRETVSDTNARIAVSPVVIDYRGYDTLYEATTLFTAVVGVLSVLHIRRRKKDA